MAPHKLDSLIAARIPLPGATSAQDQQIHPGTAPEKRFATLQAQAALHGVTLHRMDGDFGYPIYVATRWNLTKQFDSVDEVATWLQRVTGESTKEAGA